MNEQIDEFIRKTNEKLKASGTLHDAVEARRRVEPDANTIVWGADSIAPHLGRTVKGAYGALESGKIPGAKKIAGRWALNLRIFHASFETSQSQT